MPETLTANVWSQTSGSPSTSVICAPTPALAIATSRPPRALDRCATASSTWSRSATSHSNHGASPQAAAVALQQLGLEAEQRDAGAALVQPRAVSGADPAGRAGDQDAAAGERSCSSLAPAIAAPRAISRGGRLRRFCVRLDCERVERHREHLVVADEHAELDQLDVARACGAQLRPELVGDRRGRRAARRRRAAAARAAATSRGAWARRARASISSAAEAGGSADALVVAPLVRRSRSCARRAGSAARVSSRGSRPPGISAPANRSHLRNRPRWRRERREDVRRRAACGHAERARDGEVDRADVGAPSGRDPRAGHGSATSRSLSGRTGNCSLAPVAPPTRTRLIAGSAGRWKAEDPSRCRPIRWPARKRLPIGQNSTW